MTFRAPTWPRPHLRHAGKVRLPGDWVANGVCDPLWRIYFDLEPGAAVCGAWGRLELPAERIAVVPAWLPWHGETIPGVLHVHLSVVIPYYDQTSVRGRWSRPGLLHGRPELCAEFAELAQRLPGWPPADALDALRWQALALQVLAAWFRECPPPERSPRPPELRQVLDFIDSHLDEDLGNERLASLLHLSAGHFQRRFRALLGTTPAAWVKEHRLAAAAQALAESEDSIETIAERVGFANRYHFTRAFTALMRQPPAAYRKLFRNV